MQQHADPPLRQIARLRTEMAVGGFRLAQELFPGQPMLSVEFGTVALRCLPDWVRGDRVVRPDAPERAITVRQIARTLSRSPETVRRHVNQLRDGGQVTAGAQGVALATTTANEALVRRYLYGVHDLLIGLVEDLARTSDIDWPAPAAATLGIADVIARAIDVLLLPIDTYGLKGNQQAILLWGALTAFAVRGVTHDPVLARRYAIDIPPDTLRDGLSLRQLAEALGIPYATAWRQMQALHEHGLVTRSGSDHWTVLTANLMVDSAVAVGAPPSVFTWRKLRELVRLGLDPAGAAARYKVGRPAPFALFGRDVHSAASTL